MNALALQGTRSGFRVLSAVAPGLSVRAAAKLFSSPKSRPISEEEYAILEQGEPLALASGLAATAWGEGPVILLVHGWERHRASLGHFVTPLVARGKRVVAFDAPAHNDSPGRTVNPVMFMKAILGVAEELGGVRGIVAHSMGGGATVLSLHAGLRAERVVLLAPASDWDHQLRFFARFIGLSDRVAQRFIRHMEQQAGRALSEMTPEHLCPTLSQPARLFHDPEDQRVPYRDSVDLEVHWSGAKLVSVSGLGHSDLLHDECVIRQTVDFLTPARTSADENSGRPNPSR